MDFFRQQDIARRRSSLLLFYFVLAVFLVVVVFNFLIFGVYSLWTEGDNHLEKFQYWFEHIYWEHPTAAIVLIMFYGAARRHLQILDGGKAVATLVGALPVDMESREETIRKYINTVEEISIASGIPAPSLYILPRDKSINAFVAGFVPMESVMVVTQGALEKLNRDELQGVVAHEFSHILNGDMRLNMRLVVVLAGVFSVYSMGRYIMSLSGVDSYDGRRMISIFWLLGPVLYVIGYAGSLAGHLIKAAVSRQREYLADASAVQFTRNPKGIAGALYKIREQEENLLRDYYLDDINHLWFTSTLEMHLESWLSSHPPLDKRIAEIDATYLYLQRGKEIVRQKKSESEYPEDKVKIRPISSVVGQVQPGHIDYAATVYGTFDMGLIDAVHSPVYAQAVVFGLLLLRSGEHANLVQENSGVMKVSLQLREQFSKLERRKRLPLLDLVLPTLKRMDEEQKQDFLRVLSARVNPETDFDLFEFVLLCIINLHLRPTAGRDVKIKFQSLKPLLVDIQILLSLLARTNGRKNETVDLYKKHMAVFGRSNNLPYLDMAVHYERLYEALNNMRHTSMANRKLFIDVCADMVQQDGIIMPEEYELMRAICECLDCPLPPMLAA